MEKMKGEKKRKRTKRGKRNKRPEEKRIRVSITNSSLLMVAWFPDFFSKILSLRFK